MSGTGPRLALPVSTPGRPGQGSGLTAPSAPLPVSLFQLAHPVRIHGSNRRRQPLSQDSRANILSVSPARGAVHSPLLPVRLPANRSSPTIPGHGHDKRDRCDTTRTGPTRQHKRDSGPARPVGSRCGGGLGDLCWRRQKAHRTWTTHRPEGPRPVAGRIRAAASRCDRRDRCDTTTRRDGTGRM
jgi:hypothetical protein